MDDFQDDDAGAIYIMFGALAIGGGIVAFYWLYRLIMWILGGVA
jgi:hypothetical protein